MNKIKTIIKKNPFYSFFSFFSFICFLIFIDYPKLITYYSGLTNKEYKLVYIPDNFFNNEHFIELEKYHNISIYQSKNLVNYQEESILIMCPKKIKNAHCNKHSIVSIKKLPSVIEYYFKNS